jgi:4-alpha-glucanotransferase
MGEIGARAQAFIDRLAHAEQSAWQMLPINPLGAQSSPYSATSSMAGNPLLISLEQCLYDRLVSMEDVAPLRALPRDAVAFRAAIPAYEAVLHRLGMQLAQTKDAEWLAEKSAFVDAHGEVWLFDYALWEAISLQYKRASWVDWPIALRDRDPKALLQARANLKDDIDAIIALQVLFDRQWRSLRRHARDRGVALIGDMPIFVAHNAADVWAHRELFKLDPDGRCTVVAGVPPDYFCEKGQMWGNPVYRWDAMEADGFRWWKARVARLLQLFDIVRIDHFRGFAASWETPASEPNAVNGRWAPARGDALFAALHKQFPAMPFIAEDLGHITDDVLALRDKYAIPGLHILQFAFGGDGPIGAAAPELYPERSVCYPATHDNNTMLGWLLNEGLDAHSRAADALREAEVALRTTRATPQTFARASVEMAMRSGSALTLVQLQDVLGLAGAARMNTPGTVNDENWSWRFEDHQLSEDVICWWRDVTLRHGRAPRRHGAADDV